MVRNSLLIRERNSSPASVAERAHGIEGTGTSRPAQEDVTQNRVRWTDLPNKDQLFILALCRLSEPLSNVCLLPYIFFLVKSVLPPPSSTRDVAASAENGVSSQVSKYSGLLVAAFPLAQFAVSLPWGRISDAHGRRLSIISGLLVSVIANAAFGFSRNFGTLMFWRLVAGLANGNVGIMRTMTAEIVQERRFQTKAFLLLPLVFNSGMVLSLALGGCLAEPATNLPWLFGSEGLLNFGSNPGGVGWALSYPYALPALMNAIMLGCSLVLAVFGLRETLPGKEQDEDWGLRIGTAMARLTSRVVGIRGRSDYAPVHHEEGFVPEIPTASSSVDQLQEVKAPIPSPTPPIKAPRIPFRKIWTREVAAAMVSFGLLPLHNSAFMHIFPVYLSMPHADNIDATAVAFTGGLGLMSSTISLWLGVFGIGGILLQLFIYPRMQARIGTLGVLRVSLVIFPLVYAIAPYLSILPTGGLLRWLGLGVVICGQITARTMAIPSTVILVTEAAPTRNVLGTVHGAGNMLASLARAVGPAVGGWVFAWGIDSSMVGAVWWFYLVGVSAGALIWSFTMQKLGHDAR